MLSGFVLEELPNGKMSASGMNFKYLIKEIAKYNGSKSINGILTKQRSYHIEFWKFYLPDLIYLIEKTLEDSRKSHYQTHSRNLRTFLKGLYETDLGAAVESVRAKDKSLYPVVKKEHKNIKYKPFPQQVEFIAEALYRTEAMKLKGYLLDSKPGSGKTLTSLYLMEELEMDKVIVVCPKKSINTVWEETLTQKFHTVPTYSLSVPKTFTDGNDVLDTSGRFLIIHYEALQHGYDAIVSSLGEFKGKVGIILDECHNFNDKDSERSRLFRDLVKKVDSDFCLWMSGTPLKAMGKETFTMMSTIDRLFNSQVEQSFFDVFGKNNVACARIIGNRMGLIRTEMAKEEIKNELFKHSVSVTLPDGHYYTLDAVRARMMDYVKMRTGHYQARMDDYVNDYMMCIDHYRKAIYGNAEALKALEEYLSTAARIREHYDPIADKETVKRLNIFENKTIIPVLPNHLKKVFKKAKSVYKYVQLTVVGEALGNVLGKDRTACNVAIASRAMQAGQCMVKYHDGQMVQTDLPSLICNAEGKSLLFTDFVEVVDVLHEQLNDNGVGAFKLYGSNSKELNKLVSQFHRNPDIAAMVTTYKTLGEAVPITVANTVFMMNAPFRDGIYEQAFRRAYRIGQELHVDVFDVLLDTGDKPNISTRNKEIMDWSKEMVEIMMGKKGADADDLDDITSDILPEDLQVVDGKGSFKMALNRLFN